MRVEIDIDDRLAARAAASGIALSDMVNRAMAFMTNFGKVESHIKSLEKEIEDQKLLLTRVRLERTEAGWRHHNELQTALDNQAELSEALQQALTDLAQWQQVAIAAVNKSKVLEVRLLRAQIDCGDRLIDR
ncbi:MAG TPA: hypothetical protein V6C88_10355 [Chroococcidiopsis sp.]